MPISPKQRPAVDILATQLLEGRKDALAKAITMVESQLDSDKQLATHLFQLLAKEPPKHRSNRIGITGVPGVGKSTFIEAIGLALVETGDKVAVLSIDPSSAKTRGSLLGDKSRMDKLSREPLAFIRPSPTGGYLGGIARKTRECMALCEAAGFQWIIVETVGAGQNEFSVSLMVDLFVLLLLPAGGDELQGIKRGIMEMADAVLVNKADGDLKTKAQLTLKDYASALKLMPPPENGIPVYANVISAAYGSGLAEFTSWMRTTMQVLHQSGWVQQRRSQQDKEWFTEILKTTLFGKMLKINENKDSFNQLLAQISGQGLSAEAAAEQFFEKLKT